MYGISDRSRYYRAGVLLACIFWRTVLPGGTGKIDLEHASRVGYVFYIS